MHFIRNLLHEASVSLINFISARFVLLYDFKNRVVSLFIFLVFMEL